MLVLYPEKPRAVTTQQPFVASAHHKIGAEVVDAHWHGAAGLTHIQQKQCSLRVAGGTDSRGVQQSPVVIAHQARRDDSGSRRQRINQVIRCDKAVARRNDSESDALAFFHGLPGRILQRKFALRRDDLVARLPLEAVRHGGSAGACSRSDSDLLRVGPDHLRQRATDSNWRLEPQEIVHTMGKLLCFERAFYRFDGYARHDCVCCRVEVGCVFNFKPFLLPVGYSLGCHGKFLPAQESTAFPLYIYETARAKSSLVAQVSFANFSFAYFGGVTYWASPLPKDQFSFGTSTKLMRTYSLRICTLSWSWSTSAL